MNKQRYIERAKPYELGIFEDTDIITLQIRYEDYGVQTMLSRSAATPEVLYQTIDEMKEEMNSWKNNLE